MAIRKTVLTAAAVALATSVMAFQPGEADAMPRVHFDAKVAEAGDVQKVGWKKRRFRRFVRRHLRHHGHHAHGHGHGHGGGCHAHNYKVPGMHMHPRFRCGHRHFRAYRSWRWN